MRKLVAKLAAMVLVSTVMLGGPVSPAHASVPADGTYLCTNGQPSSSTPNFTITSGVVSAGASCAGAVVIPAGLTSIGDRAFYGATSLSTITIPASLSSIGDYAFEEATSLPSVTFDGTSTLTSIGGGAFYGATSLTSITIPEGVTSIGANVFFSASALTSVTFAEGSRLT